jgi:hypothetical protein
MRGEQIVFVVHVHEDDLLAHQGVQHGTRLGPTSMRKALSRSEQDEDGTSQTSIRHHPRLRSAMSANAVAPIHTGGVAMRHVGPRDAT